MAFNIQRCIFRGGLYKQRLRVRKPLFSGLPLFSLLMPTARRPARSGPIRSGLVRSRFGFVPYGVFEPTFGYMVSVLRKGLDVAVAGVPKTIDNDVDIIDRSFGFVTAVEVLVMQAFLSRGGGLGGLGSLTAVFFGTSIARLGRGNMLGEQNCVQGFIARATRRCRDKS